MKSYLAFGFLILLVAACSLSESGEPAASASIPTPTPTPSPAEILAARFTQCVETSLSLAEPPVPDQSPDFNHDWI